MHERFSDRARHAMALANLEATKLNHYYLAPAHLMLGLIAEGLSNREIADRLCLALSTVKVHNRNIYGKLAVHNRTQAAARAQMLDLL